MENFSNVKVIAQKEFTDHLKSPVFLSFTRLLSLRGRMYRGQKLNIL